MARSGTPLVEMRNISKRFGGVQAVDDVSVDLWPGEVVGLLGHNGAGKSTLIKILAGAHEHTSGKFVVDGVSHPLAPGTACFLEPGPGDHRRFRRRFAQILAAHIEMGQHLRTPSRSRF